MMKPSISALQDQGYRRFCSLGGSMLPIIRPGDELWGRAVGLSAIGVGDVIVYSARPLGGSVVHRVIKVDGDHLLTQGDNCERPDMAAVMQKDIQAKITYIRRRQRIKRVWGGAGGRLVRRLAPLRRDSRSALLQTACAMVKLVARVPLAGAVFCLIARPTVVRFGGCYAEEMKLLIRGTAIGHKKGRASGWEIRRFFRPFIDEDQLPR